MPTLHLIIKGKVQGVFYRATASKVANLSGITGWVRNTTEGNVEIIANGDAEQLKKFIDWCKLGPSRARVEHIETKEIEEQYFNEFKIMR